ncbi:MAG: nuclear transport factor 2 family protein [Rhizobiales bacterium]|nr:nuclear transport factor 2 family protein [Hyphomicrobiales bacterium]
MEQEIITLEHAFWQAIVEKDTATSMSMMDGHSILTGAQGVNVLTRSGYARMAAHSDFTIHGFALDNIHVIFPSPEVAVIGYTVREDVTVGGKRMTLNAADSSVWVKHDGRWLNVHHTEAVMGDPFARTQQAEPARRVAAE